MKHYLYTRKAAAEFIGVRYNTLYKWERRGWITPAFFTKGGKPRFTLAEIEKATVEHKKEAISCNS
jgi:predicted site-specific integrase-resolvase